jgi:hypothetical protein
MGSVKWAMLIVVTVSAQRVLRVHGAAGVCAAAHRRVAAGREKNTGSFAR